MTRARTGRAVGLPRHPPRRTGHLRSSKYGSRQTHELPSSSAFPASGKRTRAWLSRSRRTGSPTGTPGALVAARSWDDYSLGRDGALAHLGALDLVYAGVIEAHRKAITTTEDPDPVTQDMLIEQAGQLEQFHWFVRAHLEDPSGSLATSGARTEQQAAARTRKK